MLEVGGSFITLSACALIIHSPGQNILVIFISIIAVHMGVLNKKIDNYYGYPFMFYLVTHGVTYWS